MRGLVYTAIFGGSDVPQPLRKEVREKNVDYLMFTDGPGAEGWQLYKERTCQNTRLQARLIKTNMPNRPEAKDYDWTLWMDGSHTIRVPISEHVEHWLAEADFAAYKHHQWDCTYKEIQKCIEFKKDSAARLEPIRKRLRDEGFPEHYGQIASCVLVRKQNPTTAMHARAWLDAVQNMSVRDQITFMYILWLQREVHGMDCRLHYLGSNAFYNTAEFKFHYQGGH